MLHASGCSPKEAHLVQTKAPDESYFKEDLADKSGLIEALERQEQWFARRQLSAAPETREMTWQFCDRRVDSAVMVLTIQEFRRIYLASTDHRELRKALVRKFDFYKVGGRQKKNILFTGYYTPIMSASRRSNEKFTFPLYRLPSDLIRVDLSLFSNSLAGKYILGRFDNSLNKFVPYYSREEIDWGGALAGAGLEIAWLNDYIDQFFLHIQGGGILELTDGQRINVNYAGKNGRGFMGVGRLLIEAGEIDQDQMSMQAIRHYFRQFPDKIRQFCTQNESYVFYEESNTGPYGSLGVLVTPERTIAMDKKLFPGGELCLVRAKIPVPDPAATGPLKQKTFSRFVLDQDTGGAIVGKHIDLYCGEGTLPAIQAGSLHSMGDVWFLVLKPEYCPR